MSNGTDIAAEIKAALAEAGEAVGAGALVGTILRKGAVTGGPPYDPVYGPDTTHTFNVLLGSFTDREREGTAILVTDTKITASVSDVVPTTADKITVSGKTYQIYGVDPMRPGGEDLLYTIWARA